MLHVFKVFAIAYIILLKIFDVLSIVGGLSNTIAAVPHLVQIYDNETFICGGTLITPKDVATAAHCVYSKSRKSLYIKAGATRLSERGITSPVSKINIHKAFSLDSDNMDVAVLNLQFPVIRYDVRPTKLCNTNWTSGTMVAVSGWGVTKANSEIPSDQLRKVKLKTISQKECKGYYPQSPPTNKMFCTLTAKKDTCTGDSGGSGFIRGQFCAIISSGIGCARKKKPGVYTDVRAVKNFIRNVVSGDLNF